MISGVVTAAFALCAAAVLALGVNFFAPLVLPEALRVAIAVHGANTLLCSFFIARIAGALSRSGAFEVLVDDGASRTVLFSKLKEGRLPTAREIEAALSASKKK